MRRWSLCLTGLGRPFTVNWVQSRHWKLVGRKVSQWRLCGEEATRRKYGGQTIREPVTVIGQALHDSKGRHQDTAACFPAVKAVLDGVVDAGLLEDDTGEHVNSVVLLPPAVKARADGLFLWITADPVDFLPVEYIDDMALALS